MEDESCVICLVDYDAEDELSNLPCSHAFHTACTESWLAVNPSCPVCRAPFFGDKEDTRGQGMVHNRRSMSAIT